MALDCAARSLVDKKSCMTWMSIFYEAVRAYAGK
jgi:hypothetical protein